MSGNSGSWGVAMWQNNKSNFPNGQFVPAQEQGISLSGGEEVDEFLPTPPLGCLLVPPDGLGVPPVRSGDVAFAQRDGVVQFGDFYEPRQITLRVSVCNEGCPGCPTARQMVKRLTTEWSRSCASATLAIFTDCHSPDAALEEQTYLGPYLVTGRPRIAEVTWMRSNRGCADITLRFDADDARLVLFDGTSASTWSGIQSVGQQAGDNLAEDYRLQSTVMGSQDAVVDDETPSFGAPDGGSYFSRRVITPNTVSPFVMPLSDNGVNGIPATASTQYSIGWWARRSPAEAMTTRALILWYDAGGSFISTTGDGSHSPGTDWERFTLTVTSPVGAAFMQPRLLWDGIALAEQRLDLAQAWINEGSTAGEPPTVEVVGDLCAHAVYTLQGTLTAPITVFFSSEESGESSFTYNDDLGSGDIVVIDTRWGVATLAGVEVTQNVSGNFNSPLEPGINTIRLESADAADDGSLTVEWENAVVSG